jgi:hypothetical protein
MYRNDDPPDEPDYYCTICGKIDCICPECTVCGIQGDPNCINNHMPWSKWSYNIYKSVLDNKDSFWDWNDPDLESDNLPDYFSDLED